jgi:CpeT protein
MNARILLLSVLAAGPLVCLPMLSGCAGSQSTSDAAAVAARAEFDELTSWMTGTFSSAAQAKADPEFRDIVLHMAPIWPERSTAKVRWLYVEQAVAQQPAKPYRQRVYKLSALEDGSLRSDVYTLPEPRLNFVGGAASPAMFTGVAEKDLTLRDGCSIALKRAKVEISSKAPGPTPFTGGTSGTGCASDLQGAAYAVSEAIISPQGLLTWDRGFDASGKQVWGATKGGYNFVRQTPLGAPPAAQAAGSSPKPAK